MHYKKLESEHIYLASINYEDINKYIELVNDKDSSNEIIFGNYMKSNCDKISEIIDEYNDLLEKNYFAIIDKEKDSFIGIVGFSESLLLNQRANLDLKIDGRISFSLQVQYGVESINLILQYAYDVLNLNSIVVEAPVFNKQLLESCGQSKMGYLGTRRYASRYEDKYYDLIYFQCTKNNFYQNNYEVLPRKFNDNGEVILFDVDDLSLLSDSVGDSCLKLIKYSGEDEYVEVIGRYLSNPEVAIPLGEFKQNYNDKMIKELLEEVIYLIKKDDKVIGYINLIRKDFYNKKADLEIMIGDLEEQGKGYGTLALELFLEEQYKNGPFNSLTSSIFEFNKASYRVHEKVGFSKIGTRKEAYYMYGKLNNMDILEINKSVYVKR